ncbi:probable Allantoate permease [Zygosaccharomyces bailii ISA1307]|nr:probable Allantoate permease [Zygosaccharomyces bailii ISA1307]
MSNSEKEYSEDLIKQDASVKESEQHSVDVERGHTLTTIISPYGHKVEIGKGVDDAMDFAEEAKDIVVTPEEDRKLLWKIDLCMFPLMCLLYAVQFMDKVTTSSAAVMGLRTDLKMHGDQYSWVGSAFYFGFLLFNLGPGQIIFQRTKRMAKMLSVFIIVWGMILCCHAAPTVRYPTFILLRVLLGCAESMVTPCFTMITAQYWKQEEQFTRVCMWFGMNGLGQIMMSSIAYGVYIHADSYSIKPWRLLFVITGSVTIFVGILISFWIPDEPTKAIFLSQRERLMVVDRIKSNQQGFGNHQIKKHQIWEALRDVRTWLYFLFSICSNIPNGGISNFMAILLNQDFKYSSKDTFLMNIPGGAVEFVGCPLFGILAMWATIKSVPVFKSKLTWAMTSTSITLIGVCMLAFANNDKRARLAGAYMQNIAPVSFICVLSNISANTSGYTKKWTVSSITMATYAAANIAGPQTFISTQAPSYHGAKVAMVVCYAAMLVILAIILFVNVTENRRRDKLAAENGHEPFDATAFADLTDFENPNFRYTL